MGSIPATMRSAAVFLLVIGLTLGKKVTIDWNPTGAEITKCVGMEDELEFNWDEDSNEGSSQDCSDGEGRVLLCMWSEHSLQRPQPEGQDHPQLPEGHYLFLFY